MDKSTLRSEHFPVTRNVIYLNHAAVGPLSLRAQEAMDAHARDQRDFGALHWKEWYAEHDRFRRSAATLIGAQPGEMSILKNTSEGLSFVAEGLRWKSGDNVVTSSLEFPSNFIPWKRLEALGVQCRVAGQGGVCPTSEIERLVDRKTRLVTISSVAFHNGFAADLVSIGELCRERNVLFCVDAIQSLGVLPIDVRRANVSFLASDGHKWLLGPEGTAIFYCAAEAREALRVTEIGWMNVDRRGRFLDSPTDLLPDGRRFEAGSLNTNGIYGIRASIDFLNGLGIETIREEVLRLAGRLAGGLESIGFELRTPRPIASGIVAATPRAVDSSRLACRLDESRKGKETTPSELVVMLHRWLERQRIVCAPREGMLRFSPHFYNSDEEIDLVVDALRSLV